MRGLYAEHLENYSSLEGIPNKGFVKMVFYLLLIPRLLLEKSFGGNT